MNVAQRCLVIVPRDDPQLYTVLVKAFLDNARVFVCRDLRTGERAIHSVEVYAVGGGDLDADLRKMVDDELRRLRARP
jgi:hypothetical protein